MSANPLQDPRATEASAVVAALVARARAAQHEYERCNQQQVDEAGLAAGWAIIEPTRNRELAELAVRETGLGNVEDKVLKNHRKTLGLLRDLQGVRTVGVISEDPARGLIEIARPAGVVAAITPSTNPAATPANKIINALKGRNAVILAPSPKGLGTCTTLVGYVRSALGQLGLPPDLVQHLPAPVTKATTYELMRQADLIVATGSQSNVRAAYSSGTPAFGVGAGNAASIIDVSASLRDAAQAIAASKCFDNATSCSSENSVVVLEAVYEQALAALEAAGGVMLDADEKRRLRATMWPQGKLSSTITAQSAPRIAELAQLSRPQLASARFLLVEESGIGPDCPFSGEKLSPVLAVYRARNFDDACRIVGEIYSYQGAGHSVGIHSASDENILRLGLELPVCRVIVNQAHCFATGGSFDNGVPFSLSMGCGTWGGNSFSENLDYRHYLNVTRIARRIPPREPSLQEVFGDYLTRHGH
jgi:sulfoacetaldehyde dehydrogenase